MLTQTSPPCCRGGRATAPQSPGDSPQRGTALCCPGGDTYGPNALPGKVSLDPFLWNYNRPFFSFSFLFFFFHKNPKPFSVLQLWLHKPGGFSLGSEKKLILRLPLSHISTARPLSRAELGSERIVGETGRFSMRI